MPLRPSISHLETVEERDHVVHRVGGEHDTLAGGVPDGPGHHQLAQRHAQPLSNLRSEGNSESERCLSTLG